jgi:CRISPR/Cas system-associated protein Cas7 (RAMP superfamily)
MQTSQAYLLQQLSSTKYRTAFEMAAHRSRNAELGKQVYNEDRASRRTDRKLQALVRLARRIVARAVKVHPVVKVDGVAVNGRAES